jgi:hypothetical protein
MAGQELPHLLARVFHDFTWELRHEKALPATDDPTTLNREVCCALFIP